MKKTYQPFVEVIGKSKPVIGIVGAMHGNESGPAIIEKLKHAITLKKGTIKFIIANTKAREKHVRFIDEDLNRAFPGKRNGSHEKNLAYALQQIGKDIDILIDLHSCSQESAPFAIIRTTNGKDMELAKKSGLPFIVVYPLTTQGGGSFIDYVRCGIGLELGRHDAPSTIQAGFDATIRILNFLGVINEKVKKPHAQKILQVIKHFKKERGLRLSKDFANFKHFKKGQTIGQKYKKEIQAEEDFYPVLYNEKAYGTTLCWMAEEIRV